MHSSLGPIEEYAAIVERVREVDGVTAASPYLDAEGMVRGSDGEIFGVRVRGIDPVSAGDVTDLRSDLIAGSLDALASDTEPAADADSAGESYGYSIMVADIV